MGKGEEDKNFWFQPSHQDKSKYITINNYL